MSRYHPVRPKQQQRQQTPQPAAPAQPRQSEAQARIEAAADEQYRANVKQLYEKNGGLEVDASIARCKRTLEQYDRELEIVAKEDGSKQHRWTISPSIAFRFDKHLHDLLEHKEHVLAQIRTTAWQIRQDFVRQNATLPAKDSSLCPPKHIAPATGAQTQAAPAERTVATAAPIAA